METVKKEKCKNVVITGGSNGLGAAIIDALGDLFYGNFNIYNLDHEFRSDVKTLNTTLLPNILEHQVSELVRKLPERVDILINNLGINFIEWIPKMDSKSFYVQGCYEDRN